LTKGEKGGKIKLMSETKVKKEKEKGLSAQIGIVVLLLLLVAISVGGRRFLDIRSQQLQASAPDMVTIPTETTAEQVIYLVRLSPSGEVVLEPVKIMTTLTEDAIADAVAHLVLTRVLDKDELQTFLPLGTQFLGAKQVGNRVYLNFNEAFRFNSLGYDAYIAQLKQVVYTATQNPSVQEVRILIEGQEVDFLNDGVYVGAPLTRASWDDENIF
jgi:spore germination protein GerM